MTGRVVVLGCGGSSGVPNIGGADGAGDWGACDPAEARNRRSRSSVVLELDGGTLLVDTGPDLREQLLACRIARVDAIAFTHAHADHVCGIDDVRSLNRIAGRPLDAWATADTLAELRDRFAYAFLPWRPPVFYRPVLQPRAVIAGETVGILGALVATFPQVHGRIRTLGLRSDWFAYSTDVSDLEPAAFAALRGVDTWVIDCFQREPHGGHAHLERVLPWACRVGARRTILTHMGPDLDWDWMRRHLPAGVEAAFDGMVIEPPT